MATITKEHIRGRTVSDRLDTADGLWDCFMPQQYLFLDALDNHAKIEPDIIQLIKHHNLKYVDQRSSGGALWVIGGKSLSPIMQEFRAGGFPFNFKVGGGRSSGYRDAWWYKPSETEHKHGTEEKKTERTKIIRTESNDTVDSTIMPMSNATIIEQLTAVLSTHFRNGYRLNSPIEMTRFRSFAGDKLDTISDDELKNYLAKCGIYFDGKIYTVSVQTKERIKEIAEEYFSNGARVIFFAEFYAKHENWLFEASVVSEEMLMKIFRRQFSNLSFTQTYFGYTNKSVFAAVEEEILRVWGDNILQTYGQLAEKLRYIPIDRIKNALCQNDNFIWNSVETFSHVSKIDITDEERELIRDVVVQKCAVLGYTSIVDLPVAEITERNYKLSTTAVHNAVYRICLYSNFDKRGKIVTYKGNTINAQTIMKEYCRTIDKCSLNDLLDYEKELTGEVHRWMSMEAGNAVLIRVNKDTYLADKYVHFDADAIDNAIGLFVKGDYLPLKSFTTFGIFPDCGQPWNLFLLESYCRRFSKKFRFDAPAVNSWNAGAVIRKTNKLDYESIIVDAVANANVILNVSTVNQFLYENGYIGKSTTAKKAGEIIEKANAVRGRKN